MFGRVSSSWSLINRGIASTGDPPCCSPARGSTSGVLAQARPRCRAGRAVGREIELAGECRRRERDAKHVRTWREVPRVDVDVVGAAARGHGSARLVAEVILDEPAAVAVVDRDVDALIENE